MQSLSVSKFIAKLKSTGQRRAYFVLEPDGKALRASHPELSELSRELSDNERDFDGHEAIFLEVGAETGALLGAFLHKTVRGQGAGGLRYWSYETIGDYLLDGLRLAQGMGRKSALAGLWWGGGKGVIAKTPDQPHADPFFRRRLYAEYGRFISSLRGAYVTAEDVGTNAEDMASVFATTRFVTCVPPSVGGSGNPSFATAKGVVCAIEGALEHLGRGNLEGKRVVMQGAGNVGRAMIADLLERGAAEVLACDIQQASLDVAQSEFSGKPVRLRHTAPDDPSVFEEAGDIFVPNALGGVLNPTTIPLLKASLVCGAANNQLLDDRRDDRLISERGICYVPDFVANRMGIVNCANEQYGTLPDDPAIWRHFGRDWENSVFCVTQAVLERAHTERVTSTQAAKALADEYSLTPHPLWGHRARAIIDSLVQSHWERS